MAKATQTEDKPILPETLFVLDTTCPAGFEPDGKTRITRTHCQIVDGIEMPFSFTHGQPTEMPASVAMKFLKIPEFVVTGHDGKRVARTPDQPDEHSRKPFVLRDDQVVADLSELTEDALWRRCQQAQGGERLGRDAGRGRMTDFLVKARQTEQAARRGPGDGLAPAGIASIAGTMGDVSGD
jgi:hypothetical protein